MIILAATRSVIRPTGSPKLLTELWLRIFERAIATVKDFAVDREAQSLARNAAVVAKFCYEEITANRSGELAVPAFETVKSFLRRSSYPALEQDFESSYG